MDDETRVFLTRLALVVLAVGCFLAAAWSGSVLIDAVEAGTNGVVMLGPLLLVVLGWGLVFYSARIKQSPGGPLSDDDDATDQDRSQTDGDADDAGNA